MGRLLRYLYESLKFRLMKQPVFIENSGKLKIVLESQKTHLETRQCFVWTDPHIYGHFLSCFISLVIEKIHALHA